MALPTTNKSFWEDNPNAAQVSQWTSDPFIAAAIYQRISNRESRGHWIDWLFNRHLKNDRFNRILSIGCGVGDHELAIAEILPETSIDAFDFSNSSIALAQSKVRAKGLENLNLFVGNFNEIELDPSAYDLVLCSGSLHHVRELEHLLGEVRSSLTAGGLFVVNEYVGDCYNIYGEDQISFIQQVLNGLPASMRYIDHFPNPTIEDVFDRDPTEAVRAKLIPDFLRIYFSVIDERRLGGSLLHPLYPFLNIEKIQSEPDFHEAIMNGLIILDDQRLAQGRSDFSFFICRA